MTIPLATLAILLAMVLDNDIQAAEVTGVWTSEFESPIGRMKYTFDLKADGEKIEGKATRLFEGETLATKLTEGSLEGDEVSFVEVVPVDDRRIRIEYRGKIAGDE
ncbi:MAG TPA: hypothetical protein VGR78_18750, partial [Verrucomicrobiae bacterium]|nr:hypothetical protein [Verrucomicrobiae bacterium]